MNRKLLFWPLAAVLLETCEKGLEKDIADVANQVPHSQIGR